jgi:hypothetical protein
VPQSAVAGFLQAALLQLRAYAPPTSTICQLVSWSITATTTTAE